MQPETTWEGEPGSPCARVHRTTGDRAWCGDCVEWCYIGEGAACRQCLIHQQGWYLELGEGLEVSKVATFPTGTIQITIKRRS